MANQNTNNQLDLSEFECRTIDKPETFDPQKSIFIQASAGTGKTYTIQQIVARLIWACREPDEAGVTLDQILIVTYTEKAAGELKKRIRDKMEEVCKSKFLVDKKYIPVTDIRPFEAALRDIDNAQIYTIHSFCQKILREHAYETGRPLDMQLIDDKVIKELIDRKIRDEWSQNEEYIDLVRGSAEDNIASDSDGNSEQIVSIDKILATIEERLVNAVYDYYRGLNGREQDDVIQLTEPSLIRDFDDLYKIPEFKTAFDNLNHEAYFLYKLCVPGSESNRSIGEVIKLLKEWKAPDKFLDRYPKQYDENWAWPDDDTSRFIIDNYLKIIDFKYKNEEIYYADKYNEVKAKYKLDRFLYHVFPDLYLEWRKTKLANKQQSYNDMIHAVHMAITDKDSNLTREIREKYRYAIIDEFQDTNQLQWDIFKTIFMCSAEHPLNDQTDGHHSLFVVGDPKQSIFSFQGADLYVYEAATHREILNVSHCDYNEPNDVQNQSIKQGYRLGTNYRSTDSMIESCNELFVKEYKLNEDKKENIRIGFDIDFTPSGWPSNKLEPTFNHHKTPAFWLPENDSADENEFARMACARIVECCEYVDEERTRLMVFDKEHPSTDPRRSVSFKDFVVLARTRSEFPPIERELTKLGIPYVRYKDNNLFAGRECSEWIALFKALDVPDYSAGHRNVLNEALLTDFFPEHPIDYDITQSKDGFEDEMSDGCHKVHSKLDSVAHPYYDDPGCTEREQLAYWRRLASAYQWAELQETIYRDSGIETRLSSDLSKLQELTKLRQIGNYCVEYLYKKRCDISALVRHLEILKSKSSLTEDQDGNLVEKGTDLDAVRLMTIHASKGLEFPVVIAVAGFKGVNNLVKGPFVYHKNNKRYLGFEDGAKKERQKEELREWQRLFYVAYTRASSVLMLPRYPNWDKKDESKNPFAFLKNSIDSFANNHVDSRCLVVPKEYENYKGEVQKILQHKKESIKGKLNDTEEDLNKQIVAINKLQKKVGSLSLMQYSYSSLAGRVVHKEREETEIVRMDGRNPDKNGDALDEMINPFERISDCQVDTGFKSVPGAYHLLSHSECQAFKDRIKKYPGGTLLGNAVHEVFEFADFEAYGADRISLEVMSNIMDSIHRCFDKYGVKRDDDTDRITLDIVRHTLRAKLPVIHGSNAIKDSFLSLNALEQTQHFAEVEFMLKRVDGDKFRINGEHFCKGFMDLVFVQGETGKERYSVLDWKTNVLEPESYASVTDLKAVVDKEYEVQRVLYSYCLIEWLKSFTDYKDLSEEEIFEQHFGGVYYVFVRGCCEGTSNGIYAQTWDSYQELEKAYVNVKKLMTQKRGDENND